ncbi:MAG: hypothetical protein H3C62_11660, partial [Gemmatimonadaceae bacterium]|nr:hypothetical protein [Gemmatimonadaceae bacterium]
MTHRHALCALVLLLPGIAAGQRAVNIRVSPGTVTVGSQGPTTAILTFSGLDGYTPAEGAWCAALAPVLDRGVQCDPATIFAQAPRPTRSVSATGVFTDVMTVSASVAQRAYETALGGGSPRFYFVRRFEAPAMSKVPGVDQYVAVSLLLGGTGANAPFALTNVRLRAEPEAPVLFVKRGTEPSPITAEIAYTGSGRLRGRWEVVMPGEPLPTARDLMTEASLPAAERGTQRRYREIERFNVMLLPNGRFTLSGPDPSRLPTSQDGSYTLLLRVEASDDARSDVQVSGVGSSAVVANGASASFPMPTLRYIVGAAATSARIPQNVRLRSPVAGATVAPGSGLTLVWSELA